MIADPPADDTGRQHDDAPAAAAGNWLFTIAYDGTAYTGWQIQSDGHTVQGCLQACLSKLFHTEAVTQGCSRTDAGVHALHQAVTFAPPAEPPIPAQDAHRALRNMLPPDIRLLATEVMPPEFHARFKALGKCYTYVMYRGALQSPFVPRYCWSVPESIDIEAMRTAANALIGTHDFTTFSATSTAQSRDPVKTLTCVDVRESDRFVLMTVIGNAFLYKMVRRLAGFLCAVGRGALDPAATTAILHSKERNSGFDTAPPQGLFLERIFYEESHMLTHRPEEMPFMSLLR